MSELQQLPNIGKTVTQRLNEIGITSEAELRKTGAAKAYQQLSDAYPDKHLPVCYYLYSLQGALDGRDWRDYSDSDKHKLQQQAGLEPN